VLRLLAGMAALAWALAAADACAQASPPAPAETPAEPAPAALGGLQASGLRIEAAATRAAVQVADPAIEQALTLTNQGPPALVEFAELANSRVRLPTEWRRADGSVIRETILLAHGASLAVTLSSLAPQAGIYRARIRLLDPVDRHELWAGYFALERRAALPAAGVLLPPGAPFERDIGIWMRPTELAFTLHNPGMTTLTLQRPQLLELRRETGGRSRAIFVGVVDGRYECPQAPMPAGTLVLTPDASCLGIVRARIQGAGSYVARVSVTGTDGGQAAGDVRMNVRLGWYWAALVTALGSLGGWVVGTFRRVWRARSLLAEAAALQRERLARISRRAQAIGFGEVTQPTVRAVDDLIQDIQDKSDLTGLAERLAKLGGRVERLDRWQTLESHVMGTADAAATEAARTKLRVALEDLDSTDTDLSALFAAVNTASAGAARDTKARAAAQAAGASPAPPPPSGLDSPMIASRTSDAAALIAVRRKHIELIVNGVAGLALVASAVNAVWANDPTWGDLSDVLGLMITAFAVQAGGSVALGQWSGAAQSGGQAATPQPAGQ
jgi:hypothetical protein